jgi:ribonucleoside-diphosphate reductase beta chain
MASKLNVNSRLSLFPIKDHEAYAAYKEMQAMNWIAEEADLAGDRKDYEAMSENEKRLIRTTLAFFAGSDSIINANLSTNFANEIEGLEIAAVYAFQQMMEIVHQEAYGLQLEALIESKEERETLFKAVRNNEAIRAKAEFAFKYMNKDISLPRRLFAFCIAEGLHFQASFATLAYFKTKNKLEGVTKLNEWISRDEFSHCRFSAMMFKRENNDDMKQGDAEKIMAEAVAVESEFIKNALDTGVLGLNDRLMIKFVRCVADKIMVLCGFKAFYGDANPLPFMNSYGIYTKSNFFESKATNYQKPGVGQSAEDRTFKTDADF